MRGTVSTLCANTSGRASKTWPTSSGTRVEVGDEDLDAGAGVELVHLADRLGVEPRAAVGQVVAGDAGDGGVAQAHLLHRLGDPARLVAVEVLGAAGVDLAEVAAAGALLATDEEGRLAVLPALEDVGQPASWHTVCRPSVFTSERSSVYSGPIFAVVRIHSGLRSIGVSALRASTRSIRRPSGATLTKAPLPCAGQRADARVWSPGQGSEYARDRYRPARPRPSSAARGGRSRGRVGTAPRPARPPYRPAQRTSRRRNTRAVTRTSATTSTAR